MFFGAVGDVSPGGQPGASGPAADSSRRAWVQVAASFVGLAVLAWQLPSPWATLSSLSGSRPWGAGDVADTAMLTVASTAVWLLLGWVLLISTVALAGRLPGAVGSAARAALMALAPVAVRNVLLTVVGASMVTGLAGCAIVGSATDAVAVGSAAGATVGTSIPVSAAAATAPASQLRAERLIGIATLRISDRIAVEGSAVRSAGSGPTAGESGASGSGEARSDAGGPAPSGPAPSGPTTSGRHAPSLDWPVGAAGPAPAAPSPAAPTQAAPTQAAPSSAASSAAAPAAAPAALTSPAPAVSVDWPGPAAHGAQAADRSVVVLRGDSLWTIAARSLPAGADDATVDRTWRAWYAANTPVIGSDPDQLLPGQILVPPTPETGTS